MEIIFSASLLAAFLAGMVALFAPCCITVLLPAYLASVFRQKKNVLKMTFVFFLGITVILLPIGLGAAGLAKLFQNFHRELWIFGGLLMIFLAILAVLGKGLSLVPMPKIKIPLSREGEDPAANLSNFKSIFLLGLFSGAATSCCAPVLAGAVTLAVISGTFWKALTVTLVYIFGMIFPLFLAAYFYDRFRLSESRLIKGKLWEIKVGSKKLFLHSTNLLAGIVFLIMGVILLSLALSHNVFWAPSFQEEIGKTLNQWSQTIVDILKVVPDIIWGIIILGFFVFFLYRLFREKKSSK